MKTIKKLSIAAIVLAVFMLVVFTLGGKPIISKANVRTIDTDAIATLSYDEKAQQELDKFDEYEVYEHQEKNGVIKFVGTRSYAAEEFSDCDYVAMTDEEVNVTYDLSCDTNTTSVSMEITYEQKDEVLNVDYVNISKIEYQEDSESAIIYFEDGTVVNSKDYLGDETLDNCVVIAAAAAGTMTVLLQVVVVVLVAVVVYFVLSWLFPWIKRAITNYRYENRTTYQSTTYAIPAIAIDGIRYEAKAKSKAEVQALPRKNKDNDPPIYYLAFASGISNRNGITDTVIPAGGLYISNQITYEQAIGVMTTSQVATVVRDGVTYSFIPSIYTYYESDILDVMDMIGYHTDTPRLKPEWHLIENGSVNGLPHYHPANIYDLQVNKGNGTKTFRHHAFFWEFNFSIWNTYQYA